MKGTVSRDSTDENLLIELDQDAAAKEDCSSCGLRHHCGLPSTRTIQVRKSDLSEDVIAGDSVEVEVRPSIVVWLSVSVYVLPIIMLVAGGLLMPGTGEWVAVPGAMLGLAVGLLFNIALNRWIPIRKIISVKKRC